MLAECSCPAPTLITQAIGLSGNTDDTSLSAISVGLLHSSPPPTYGIAIPFSSMIARLNIPGVAVVARTASTMVQSGPWLAETGYVRMQVGMPARRACAVLAQTILVSCHDLAHHLLQRASAIDAVPREPLLRRERPLTDLLERHCRRHGIESQSTQ
ncbi:hypothetical protein BDV93DRAFT_353441 [Ceratobasidium sp. AG-I]|nr:hypothetical protein BDV93DRAFT_353441 [Ceratobasidium sp. AG-I]